MITLISMMVGMSQVHLVIVFGGQYGNDRSASIVDSDVTVQRYVGNLVKECPDVILGCTDSD